MTRPPGLRPVAPRSTPELAAEWDRLAEERATLLSEGSDLSALAVVQPCVLRVASGVGTEVVLDVGCGTGQLTGRLAERFPMVVGIDPSAGSVDLASANVRSLRVSFEVTDVERHADMTRGRYGLIVANMVLMDVANLGGVLGAVRRLCEAGATVVASITHPCFWPEYWGYASEPWFDYNQEQFIEARFATADYVSSSTSTHVHRPLGRYVSEFGLAQLTVTELVEPTPPPSVQRAHPDRWRRPRFLVIVAQCL